MAPVSRTMPAMNCLLTGVSRSDVNADALIRPIASSPKLFSSASSPAVPPPITGSVTPASLYCFMNFSGLEPAKPCTTASTPLSWAIYGV